MSGTTPIATSAAAAIQVPRQPIAAITETATMGNTACPVGNPRLAMLTALPRSRSKWRAMLVSAVWLIRPWPARRETKMASPSTASDGAQAIDRHAIISNPHTSPENSRSGKRSIWRPAQIRTMPLTTVAAE